jgi:hypothetical protein
MTTSRDRLDDVVTQGLAPILKAIDRCKQGSYFRKDISPTIQLVNVQSGQWNSQAEGQFTVNVGVYHRDFAILNDAWRQCHLK